MKRARWAIRRPLVLISALAVVLSGLVWGASPATAGTKPYDATYGANAAVDVRRSPSFPACTSGTPNIYNQWTVTGNGNPYSQNAFNDAVRDLLPLSTAYARARVDLSAVSYFANGTGSAVTAAAVLKVSLKAAGTGTPPAPDEFTLRMYLASDSTTQLLWDTVDNRWETGSTGTLEPFADGGNAYALYSGGFMHNGQGRNSSGILNSAFDIGTFLLIGATLPSGYVLTYSPSDVAGDNICSSSMTYATDAGMNSTSLGGSGTITVPGGGTVEASAPIVTIYIDANGGRCTENVIAGYQSTWTTAPNANSCARADSVFTGFNTSSDGSGLAIAPSGDLNLTGDNTLYAQYGPLRVAGAPTDVVATGGYKNVKVSWKAPTDTGTSPIAAYLVQSTPGGSTCVTNERSTNILECTFTGLVPGTPYTFKVQALNRAGWGEFSTASIAATPFNLLLDSVSRPEVKLLFIKRGSNLEAQGRAPGLAAGTVLTPVVQMGSGGDFVPLTKETAKVNSDSAFSWSKRLDKKNNGKLVSMYFTYGDAKTATLTAKLGATVGLPSAPRDVKVTSGTEGFTVSWKPPARDGGSQITEYVMTSDLRATSWAQSRFVTCTVKAPATSCTRQGSSTVFDPNKTYTFSVVAKTERGTSPQATNKWKGQLYRLNIFKRARVDSEVLLSFSAFGWPKDARGFEIQAKVGENGTWKKQGTASLDPDYVEPIGDWSGMLPKSVTAGSTVFYRVKSNKGFSNEVRFRLSSSFEYSFG